MAIHSENVRSSDDSLLAVIPHIASVLLREMYYSICDKTKQQVVVHVGDQMVSKIFTFFTLMPGNHFI